MKLLVTATNNKKYIWDRESLNAAQSSLHWCRYRDEDFIEVENLKGKWCLLNTRMIIDIEEE